MNRVISDNILIAHEVMHFIKKLRKGDDGVIAIEMHMSKACVTVDWKFLRMLMQKLGFDGVWIDRVVHCVESVSYRVKIKINSTRHVKSGYQQNLLSCRVTLTRWEFRLLEERQG